MIFVWNAGNVAHIARHGLTTADIESLEASEDLGFGLGANGRILIEGTIHKGCVRVVVEVMILEDNQLYPITAYRISTKRRKTRPMEKNI